MDTYTCPACQAPLKLALVPVENPNHLKFTAPDPVPAEAAAAAISEPEERPASPLADRPDVVAAKQGVMDQNKRCTEHLRAFIAETGGWYDPLSSPEIFDKFQAWAVAKFGHPFTEYSKHRLSKVLVEQIGATWHKTGKGRMYRLPDDLRPASRPASEDYPVVPVGPAPTTPAPLTVVPADNVVQLRTYSVDGQQDDEGRCPAWMVERGAPSVQCALPAEHIDAGADHEAEGWWWDGAGLHGRLTATGQDNVPPFVDFPETTEGGEVSVTEDGVFDAAGERLPGDDEPVAVADGWFAEGGESVPGTDSLPAGPELEKGPDGVFRLPADNLAVAAAPVAAAAPLVELPVPVTPDDFVYGVAEGAFPAEVAEHVAEGTVGGYSVDRSQLVADAQAEFEEEEAAAAESPLPVIVEPEPVDVTEVLPQGARLCSCPLTEEQIGWPLRRIAEIFDRFAAGQGLVRLGSLADIDLRKIMSQRYATAMVAPAGNVQVVEENAPAAPVTYQPAVSAPESQAPVVEEKPADPVGVVQAVRVEPSKFALAVSADQSLLPFGALEDLFTAALPVGVVADGSPVELEQRDGRYYVVGRVVDSLPVEPPVAGAAVSGEDLQGLVGGDAAAAALAAYRAASAGLAVPDHVADEGDWG